jgi:hypothetical protein
VVIPALAAAGQTDWGPVVLERQRPVVPEHLVVPAVQAEIVVAEFVDEILVEAVVEVVTEIVVVAVVAVGGSVGSVAETYCVEQQIVVGYVVAD